jgi:YaiO family outer membrane protein
MRLTRATILALGVLLPFAATAQQASPLPQNVSPGSAGIVSPGGTVPQAAPDGRTTVGVAGSYERLTGNQPSWRDYSLRFNKDFGSRRILDATVTEATRFGQNDTQASAMYSSPINSTLAASVEGNFSPTHRVLSRYSLGGALQYEFARAWLAHGGLKTTEFNDVRVNQGLLMLEHYFSDFSLAVALRPSRAFGTTANSTELRGGYYYGDRNSISLSLSGGREATTVGIGAGSGVVLTDVQTLALFGRHWLNRNWSANYAIGHTRQGDFYSRNGISLGVGYSF